MFITEKRFERAIQEIYKRLMVINERLHDSDLVHTFHKEGIDSNHRGLEHVDGYFRALCEHFGLELTYKDSQRGKWVVKKKKKGK